MVLIVMCQLHIGRRVWREGLKKRVLRGEERRAKTASQSKECRLHAERISDFLGFTCSHHIMLIHIALFQGAVCHIMWRRSA